MHRPASTPNATPGSFHVRTIGKRHRKHDEPHVTAQRRAQHRFSPGLADDGEQRLRLYGTLPDRRPDDGADCSIAGHRPCPVLGSGGLADDGPRRVCRVRIDFRDGGLRNEQGRQSHAGFAVSLRRNVCACRFRRAQARRAQPVDLQWLDRCRNDRGRGRLNRLFRPCARRRHFHEIRPGFRYIQGSQCVWAIPCPGLSVCHPYRA